MGFAVVVFKTALHFYSRRASGGLVCADVTDEETTAQRDK